MKHQFKPGDGVICSSPEEATRLRTLAFENEYECCENNPDNGGYNCFCFDIDLEILSCAETEISNPIHPDTFEALVTGKSVPVGNLSLCERLGVSRVVYFEEKKGSCLWGYNKSILQYVEDNDKITTDNRNSLQSTLEKALQLTKEGKENEERELVKWL